MNFYKKSKITFTGVLGIIIIIYLILKSTFFDFNFSAIEIYIVLILAAICIVTELKTIKNNDKI